MCELLEVSRSLVYYHLNKEPNAFSKEEEIIEEYIKEIFRLSRNNYGTRKINEVAVVLAKAYPNNESNANFIVKTTYPVPTIKACD